MADILIITGASKGLGEKTISLFIQRGWKAINIARTNCKVPGVLNVNIDLSASDWTDKFTNQLQLMIKDANKICLVHNAAVFESDNITSLAEDNFRSILNVNLVAPVALNQIALPSMKPGSSIIYIGSTLSEQAVPNRASYVITKHAMVGLMRSTCQDLAGKDIHTCCICPGFMNTGMLTDNADMERLQQMIKAKVTAGRLIEPEEVAEFIYFSAMNPVVNGAVLHANLGQIMS